jgi:hypothetical protein
VRDGWGGACGAVSADRGYELGPRGKFEGMYLRLGIMVWFEANSPVVSFYEQPFWVPAVNVALLGEEGHEGTHDLAAQNNGSAENLLVCCFVSSSALIVATDMFSFVF